ncbi:MAG TPA: acyl-CoA dehydratase activase [Candidatus Baltobacteraceae bacterium]|nr:acyl-CoA dehydratase activase [Candidatus Baltobacteraceae bacterium]
MTYFAGVDVGSTQTKCVIVDARRAIVARALVDTGANVTRAGDRGFAAALDAAGIAADSVGCVAGTGYGRFKVTFGDLQITEITCHAKGASSLFPGTRTVIDMGGQDAKAIGVRDGEVTDFVMNDKCAAGTGRFLSTAAETLGLDLGEIGPLSLRATHPVRLSTVCTVFVESDIMAYVAQGKKTEDILGGIHSAIAARTIALARRVGLEPEITFTGGVSLNAGMVAMLEEKLGQKLNVSPDSHYMGAIGAALFACEHAMAAAAS